MTDAELQGIAAQAFNMAKRDIERGSFNFLLASYHANEGVHRMAGVEAMIIARLGKEWLNSGRSKDIGFQLLRAAVGLLPPDAIVFALVANRFEMTAKMLALPPEKQKEIVDGGHDRHHAAVKQGFMTVHDALVCMAQTPERVCLYTQKLDGDDRPEVQFMDQSGFDGRLKMYGGASEPSLTREFLKRWKSN